VFTLDSVITAICIVDEVVVMRHRDRLLTVGRCRMVASRDS